MGKLKVMSKLKVDFTKKELYLAILGIIAGELMIFGGYASYGLGIYVINLLTIIIGSIHVTSEKTRIILQNIVLLILLRMIGLSVPQFYEGMFMQWLLTYMTMLIPICYITSNWKKLSNKSSDIYLVLALLTGGIIAIYQVFNPLYLEIIYMSGKFTATFLIITMMISLFLLDTKYLNRNISDILDMCRNSLLPLFIITVIIYMKKSIIIV